MLNIFEHNNKQLTKEVKKVVEFVYKIYTHFLDEQYINYKPFIITGINYIIDVKNNEEINDILDYFIDQMENDTDKDNQMYELLQSVFSVE